MASAKALLIPLLACILSLLPQSAFPESAPEETARLDSLLAMPLEELVEQNVSLATGYPQPLKTAPAVATVITAEEIKRTGAATLDEALQTVAGLTVMPSNFNRLNTVYSIRGIHTQQNPQILLLIDGRTVQDKVNGNRPNTFAMSTANIARIEVVKGPGSALHGADAFAGTINIITKDAGDIDGVEAGLRAGSFGYTDTWLQYGGTISSWDVALSLDYLRQDGDTSRIVEHDLQTSLDQAFGTSASHAPGPLETDDRIHDLHLAISNDNWELNLWKWGQQEGGEGAGSAQALDPKGHEDVDMFVSDLTYLGEEIGPDLDMEIHLGYIYYDQDNYLVIFPPGAVIPIGTDGNINFASPAGMTLFPDGVIGNPGGLQQTYNTDLVITYDGLDNHLVRFGGGYEHTDFDTYEEKNFGPGVLDRQPLPTVQHGTLTDVSNTGNVFMEDQDRTSWYLLLQDEWDFAQNWELTAGLRYDHYSDFGSTLNPRLALVWECRYDLTAKLLYGRAFRAPSFSELYFMNNPLALGNEDLDPEIIDTLELAFSYQPLSNLHTSLNLFAYEIDGLIDYIQNPGQTSNTARNAKDQKGHGFEVEAYWLISKKLTALGNFSYQNSEDEDTGERIAHAPEMVFYADLHWLFLPDWSLNGQYYWMGGRKRTADDPRPDIKDNDTVNLTVRRQNIGNHLEMGLAVRNLFNEDVREPSTSAIPGDYPMEERSFWAELTYRF